MPEDKSEEQQKIDEARAIFNARKTEIENNVRYLKMLGRSYEQEITEIEAEIEELKQIKNNLQCSQTNRHPPIKPLPKPFNWNY